MSTLRIARNASTTLDPKHGTGKAITLSAAVIAHEKAVYDADPTGGNPSNY